MFENLVSSEVCKTEVEKYYAPATFENLVSSEVCKTRKTMKVRDMPFENLVSSEVCKTVIHLSPFWRCLRTL